MSSAPLQYNCPSIGGMVCISLEALLGVISIIFTAKTWTYDTYSDDYYTALYAAIGIGCLALVFAIIAYPLTYVSANSFQKQNSSTGIKGLMITSWVFYGITIINGIAAIYVGASGGDVTTAFVVYIVLWGLVGWSFMFAHAEKARRYSPGQASSSSAVAPQNATILPDYKGSATTNVPSTVITKFVTENADGTRTIKTVKRTTNPDGSIVVEEMLRDDDIMDV